jgi:hypothetical protein
MMQLCFKQIPVEDHRVYPIIPQLFLGRGLFEGDWSWGYSSGITHFTNHPETSEGILAHSPFKKGQYLEGRTVSNVRVFQSNIQGWVWIVTLQDPDPEPEDFKSEWRFLLRCPEHRGCFECSAENTDLKLVPDYRIYDPRGVIGANPDIIVGVCKECEAPFKEKLAKQWDDYLGRAVEDDCAELDC